MTELHAGRSGSFTFALLKPARTSVLSPCWYTPSDELKELFLQNSKLSATVSTRMPPGVSFWKARTDSPPKEVAYERRTGLLAPIDMWYLRTSLERIG